MAIGVFDSGVGGLTVFKSISEKFPKMDMYYLGDTARVPYGNKSPETVINYSLECAGFLVNNFKIDTIVIACNTASSYAIDAIREKFGVNVIGVVEPGAKSAVAATRNNKIGVIGTRATVRSESYVKALKKLKPEVEVYQTACPLFVPIVEEMLIETDLAKQAVQMYLSEMAGSGIDTLILGCTHYPLLKKRILEKFPHFHVVDSSEAIIDNIQALHIPTEETGKREIYLTDESPAFEALKTVLTGGVLSKRVVL